MRRHWLPDLDRPDVCVFDLDPSNDDVAEVRAAAIGLRDLYRRGCSLQRALDMVRELSRSCCDEEQVDVEREAHDRLARRPRASSDRGQA
jgi:hypothetical protein